jgi:hypothetical protein
MISTDSELAASCCPDARRPVFVAVAPASDPVPAAMAEASSILFLEADAESL